MVKVVAAVKLLVACVKIACLRKKAVAGTARRDLSIWGGFKGLFLLRSVFKAGHDSTVQYMYVVVMYVCMYVYSGCRSL